MFKTNKEQRRKTNLLSWMLCSLAVFVTITGITSCSNDSTEELASSTKKEITIHPITPTGFTRTDGGTYSEAYRCSSTSSSLVSNIYVDSTYNKAWINMLNSADDVAYSLDIRIDPSKVSKNSYRYTAFNELGEPVMGGTFNYQTSMFSIDKVYGNDLVTRASAASWGCNMGLMAAGLAWSIPASMVSMGASVAISIAYTAAAVQFCNGL